MARRENEQTHRQQALLEKALDRSAARERQLYLQVRKVLREKPELYAKWRSAQSASGTVRAEALQTGATRLLLEDCLTALQLTALQPYSDNCAYMCGASSGREGPTVQVWRTQRRLPS